MDIEKLLDEKAWLIDSELEAVFPRDIKNLHDAVWYHLETGGTRIRPVLAIITCEALGGDIRQVLPFAAACEVFHNWCLVHDDIMDSDIIRRSKPAVWVKYGLPHGINVGDYMSEKVYELILRSKNYGVDNETVFKLLSAMNETARKTSEGQALDVNARNAIPTERDYMELATLKTAYYLTVPILGGAIVAGADDSIIEKIREFGMYAGPAFQIADDFLDLTKGKGRKEIGRDIKEGKKSLLMVHCIENCSKSEKKKLISMLDKPADKKTKKDVDYVKGLFEKYGSVDYAKMRAEDLAAKAKKPIKTFPVELKELLEEFADYLVQRDR
jgi:geranylgeranyl pyrophosphate synthase